MGVHSRSLRAGVAAAIVAAGLGIGVAAGQSGGAGVRDVATIDPTCVEGVGMPDPGPGAEPWRRGLMTRSDALDRRHGLGRYSEGGECADLPRWFVALMLRSDAVNRAEGLGAYSSAGR